MKTVKISQENFGKLPVIQQIHQAPTFWYKINSSACIPATSINAISNTYV